MHKRQLSSLSVVLVLASWLAAGCGDDTVSACDSGNCAGDAGDSGSGGASVGGRASTGGTVTNAGQVGAGATTNAGNGNGAGAAGGSGIAGASNAGTTSFAGGSSVAGSANAAGTANAAGATTAGTPNTGGTPNTAGAATAGSPGAGGTSSDAGASSAGSPGLAGAAGTGGTVPVVPAAAILKYDFEDGTGTKVSDSSGNGRDGELAGATWTTNVEGRNAFGLNFALADSATVALPDNLFTSAAGLTVSAWVKLNSNAAGNCLFDFGSAPDNHIYLTLNNDSGATSGLELGVQLNGGDIAKVYTTALLPLNVWKHVTVVLNTSGARLYVDGWEVARNTSMAVSPAALGSTTNNWIGRSQVPLAAFDGTIDEFYVYDNALTQAEIRERAWPKNDYSIWHFDEQDGTVAADSSDFKRNGTMVRAAFSKGVIGNSAQLYNPSDTDDPPVGADQYVQLPEGVVKDCTSGYTVAAWVKVIAIRTHARVFEFSNDTTACIFGRTMGGYSQQWALADYTTPTVVNPYASIDYTWSLGTWHHVAAVRDGQVLHAYLDGVESGTKTPYTLPSTVPPVSSLGSTLYNYIGRTRDSAAVNERRRLHGYVDEFLLSCRPYTASEIKLLAVRQ